MALAFVQPLALHTNLRYTDWVLIRLLMLTAVVVGCASGGGAQRVTEAGAEDARFDSSLANDAHVPHLNFENRGKPLSGTIATTCMVENSRGVLCWGSNSRGQLGRGALTPEQDFTPGAVLRLADVVSIDGRSTRFCALTEQDEVFCWGHASRYASGILREEGVITEPTRLEVLPAIIEISVGQGHTCALEKDGGVWCWGSNYAGQVGTGETSVEEPPTRVQGLENIKGVAVGNAVTCVLSNDGTVRCWGANISGIVPTESFSVTPVVIDGLGAVAVIRMGANNACAIEEGGALKCWGRNLDSQLGSSVSVDESVSQPITIELPETPIDVQVGRATICALSKSRTLYCWGDGGDGEIGDGEATDRDTPRGFRTRRSDSFWHLL